MRQHAISQATLIVNHATHYDPKPPGHAYGVRRVRHKRCWQSWPLLNDPDTTLPPPLVAPHACLDAVADADAALLGMTCSYNDMHISVRIAMSTHGISCKSWYETIMHAHKYH